jgi:hypothetical protein
MKSYKRLFEELDLSGNKDIDDAILFFNKEMDTIFDKDEYTWVAHFDHTLGKSINFAFSKKGWKYTPTEFDSYMMFMLPINKQYTIESLYMKNLKFSNIVGKSIMDATTKLVDWFKNNKNKFGE